jgi:hypothetical protein
MRRVTLLVLTLFIIGCGGSASNSPVTGSVGQTPGTASLTLADGGTLADPQTGHAVTFAENALNQNTFGALKLLPAHLQTEMHPDFTPVGVAFEVDLGEADVIGQLTAIIPFESPNPENIRLYWQLSNGLLFPLETTYDSVQQSFSATVPEELVQQLDNDEEFDSSILSFGLLDETNFWNRPDHVDWPSYNLYVFEGGAFVKYLNQGQPVAGRNLPEVGDSPLFVVHGLGSNIPNFNSTVSGILKDKSYSRVYGFEYDTLSSITTSGPKLREAYTLVEQNGGRDWSHLAHSMGCVVSRQAMENGGSLPYQSNSVVMAAGPHIGSPIINALQGDIGLFSRFITFLVVNGVMDFRNADGKPCKVSLTDAGFADLANGSAVLATLNNGAAGRHPKETYRTLGGNRRGLLFGAANYLAGVYLDDGFVNLVSANPGGQIGVVENRSVPNNHLDITTSTRHGLRVILEFLSR